MSTENVPYFKTFIYLHSYLLDHLSAAFQVGFQQMLFLNYEPSFHASQKNCIKKILLHLEYKSTL